MGMATSALAQAVRDARRSRRWTQAELARRAGVSTSTVSNVERGKTDPQAGNRAAILTALEIELGDEVATTTRSELPPDVQVILDMLGLYLTSLKPARRRDVIRRWTAEVLGERDPGDRGERRKQEPDSVDTVELPDGTKLTFPGAPVGVVEAVEKFLANWKREIFAQGDDTGSAE